MPETGKQVGKWRLVRPLGEGATSRVWLAVGMDDPAERVAIKLIRPRALAGALLRFQREVQFLARLEHPHIVSLRDSGALADDGLLYIVMDFVEGEDLDRWIRHGPRPRVSVVDAFTCLADALRYAHAHGIFHRDLKPQNIIVRPDGTACVIDFGIALEEGATRITHHNVLPGTVGYFPPEVFHSAQPSDPRMRDIYALGMLLYETLTGHYAFAVDASLDVRQATARIVKLKLNPAELDPGPAFPQALRELVLAATHVDPDIRLTSMAAFHRALTGDSGGLATSPVGGEIRRNDTVWLGEPETEDIGIIELPPGIELEPTNHRPVVSPPKPPPFSPPPTGRPGQETSRHVMPRAGGETPSVGFTPPSLKQTGQDLPDAPEATVTDLPPAPEPGGRRFPILWLGAAVGVLAVMGAALLVAVTMNDDLGGGPSPQPTPVPSPEPTAAPPPVIEVRVEGEGKAWWDGRSVAVDAGEVRIEDPTPGAHTLMLSVGDGCDGEPPEASTCCAVASTDVVVVEGQPLPEVSLVTPVAPTDPRRVELTVVEASSPVTVTWDDVVLEQADAASWVVEAAELGAHVVRVESGTCPPEAAGCQDDGACPPGCGSLQMQVEVTCGEETERVELDVPMVAAPEPTPTPTPRRDPVPRATPRPTPTPEPTPEPTPAGVQIKIEMTTAVTKGGLDPVALRSATGAQLEAARSCYDRYLKGGRDAQRQATVGFKVLRNGTVDVKSIHYVSRSSESALDACTRMLASRLVVTGTKRPGEGTLTVSYHAF